MTTSRKVAIISIILLGVKWEFNQNSRCWDLSLTLNRCIVASAVRIVYGSQIASTRLTTKTDVDDFFAIKPFIHLALRPILPDGRKCLAWLTETVEGLTTLLYRGLMEAGISIIATNLPSLHFLVTKKSVRSIVVSLRSQLSLKSNTSSRSKSGRRTSYDEMKANNSSAS